MSRPRGPLVGLLSQSALRDGPPAIRASCAPQGQARSSPYKKSRNEPNLGPRWRWEHTLHRIWYVACHAPYRSLRARHPAPDPCSSQSESDLASACGRRPCYPSSDPLRPGRCPRLHACDPPVPWRTAYPYTPVPPDMRPPSRCRPPPTCDRSPPWHPSGVPHPLVKRGATPSARNPLGSSSCHGPLGPGSGRAAAPRPQSPRSAIGVPAHGSAVVGPIVTPPRHLPLRPPLCWTSRETYPATHKEL